MKTPKRTQEKCWRCGGDVVIRNGHNGSFCPTCNYYVNVSPRLLEQHARWTRKNRDARLRHRIARLEEHILWQRQKAQEILDHLQNNVVPFWDSIDTYGHDIEGS